MWNKYVMEIKKDGYIKYISHLDMVKLFKNAFKRAEIKLAFSQGFNPHPKMGFAQPLSLGYSSSCELIEFETKEDMEPAQILDAMQGFMPRGIELLSCKRYTGNKSVAARTFAASYEITIPISAGLTKSMDEWCADFLKQETIVVTKRQKKTGKQQSIDIKSKIRSLSGTEASGKIVLNAKLDSGSNSNVSPELLISSFTSFAGIETAREEIDVKRTALFFD
ncbi:MAG: TIGR03936 family radical SAM-associated protein [Clostridiales bacterium]|nr:TIGR03936 family radical SAM-associated protein [Clostridiales bacterium]